MKPDTILLIIAFLYAALAAGVVTALLRLIALKRALR